MPKTAIMIDGGFYRKRARHLWGEKTAEDRAKELEAYCKTHLHQKDRGVDRQLYRIFYYDCAPAGRRSVYHPLTRKNVDLDKSAKMARREGVDFILDPMWADIRPSLFEHIDGLSSMWKKTGRDIKIHFNCSSRFYCDRSCCSRIWKG